MTPTWRLVDPLVAKAVSDLNCDIVALMSLVNEATVTFGTVLDPDVFDVEFPHAAATIAIPPRHAIKVSDLRLRNCVSPPDVLVSLGTIILGALAPNSQARTRFSREVLTLSNQRDNRSAPARHSCQACRVEAEGNTLASNQNRRPLFSAPPNAPVPGAAPRATPSRLSPAL